MVKSLLASMSNITNLTELSNKINVLDVIFWLHKSLNQIKSHTVKQCFIKAGFHLVLDEPIEDPHT